jgi:hypothetical protein
MFGWTLNTTKHPTPPKDVKWIECKHETFEVGLSNDTMREISCGAVRVGDAGELVIYRVFYTENFDRPSRYEIVEVYAKGAWNHFYKVPSDA